MAEDHPASGQAPAQSVPQEGRKASGLAASMPGAVVKTEERDSPVSPSQAELPHGEAVPGSRNIKQRDDSSPPVKSEQDGSEDEEEEEEEEEEDADSQDQSLSGGCSDEEAQGQRSSKAGDKEYSDDGTGVLAPHTKVVVIGNNRTKADMIGKRGSIKKSVGLGGWHFLRLTNGEEVKLQRNALSVVELPTGNEPDFTDDEDDQEAATAKAAVPSSRKRRIKAVGAGELSRRVAGKRNVSSEAKQSMRETNVDFNKLDIGNLRKYRRHYRLNDVAPNSSKDQLVSAVTRHFRMQTVDEGMVMSQFYRAIQKHGAKVA